MRALRSLWAAGAAALVALTPALADAQDPAYILSAFRPTIPGVEYDTPSSKEEIAACKVESVKDEKQNVGFAVRDAQGKLLRKFVDTNGAVTKRDSDKTPTTHLDRWSYYRDGFEVYRESDTNEDGVLDEVRWLNAGGTRVGQVKPTTVNNKPAYRVASWSRISAEEASKILVQALTSGDVALLETVMARPEDVQGLGLPEELAKKIGDSAGKRVEEIRALMPKLKGWTRETTWARFDGTMPRVIPADPSASLGQDLVLYENGVIFVNAGEKADPRNLAYLHVPELVRIGDTWKFSTLPSAVDPSEQVSELAPGVIRPALYRDDQGQPGGGPDETIPPELQKELADHDAKMPAPDDDKAMAQWHLDRITILNKILKVVTKEDVKLNYYKMVVHDLAEAYRTGLYPQGAQVFDNLIKQGGKLGSFAAYRKILAEFDLEAEKPGVDLLALQKDSIQKLEKFLADYPASDEVPEVLFQIATVHEFNNAEDQAKTFWTRLAQQHADSAPGKKAAGALKRLGLEGKPLALSGPTTAGKDASTADFKGKNLLVVYWMSSTEPDRREVEELVKLYEKHREKGFEILSVNLDPDRAALDEYLKTTSLPWPVIFEEGGLDSRLANELGVISTPTMILLDGQGTVVSQKIRKASEVEKYLEKPLASRPVGLN